MTTCYPFILYIIVRGARKISPWPGYTRFTIEIKLLGNLRRVYSFLSGLSNRRKLLIIVCGCCSTGCSRALNVSGCDGISMPIDLWKVLLILSQALLSSWTCSDRGALISMIFFISRPVWWSEVGWLLCYRVYFFKGFLGLICSDRWLLKHSLGCNLLRLWGYESLVLVTLWSGVILWTVKTAVVGGF